MLFYDEFIGHFFLFFRSSTSSSVSYVRTLYPFVWFLSGRTPDTRLATCELEIKHTPTMAAAVALRPPWCPTPGAAAHINHPT